MITHGAPSRLADADRRSLTPLRTAPDGRRDRILELVVFLLLIVPSMVLSLVVRVGAGSFSLVAASTIIRDLGLVALVVFLVHSRAEPFRAIGWDVRSAGRELVIGVLLFPVFTFASTAVDGALRSFGLSGPTSPRLDLVPADDAPQLLLAVVLVGVVAVSEETIFRGYLLRRFEQVTGSATVALVASSLIFALGHGYEGVSGILTAAALGAGLALVYRWRGSLVAPAATHFLLDLWAIVVLPLLLRAS